MIGFSAQDCNNGGYTDDLYPGDQLESKPCLDNFSDPLLARGNTVACSSDSVHPGHKDRCFCGHDFGDGFVLVAESDLATEKREERLVGKGTFE